MNMTTTVKQKAVIRSDSSDGHFWADSTSSMKVPPCGCWNSQCQLSGGL
jgi:hypothetical protein